MSFSNILNTVSFLSNNEMATFLKQTKMKRSWCRSKHMIKDYSLITGSSSFFFYIKLDTFIQLFLGL